MPAANAGQAFALVVVDELVRHGVTDAVLAPGSRSTPLALAFAQDDRIRLHVRIDERSASFLAVGLARTSGRVVPLLCTSGTAAAEFHAAVLEADQSRVPLLVLTADRPPELRGVGANQTVDQIKLYGAAVRWFCEVGVPEARADAVRYWRSSTSRAVAAANGMTGPAGPVHLNVALREPLVPTDDGVGFAFDLDGRASGAPWTAAVGGDRRLPDDVRSRLESAQRGVVVAGDGLRPADADAVVAFAESRAWPLLAEPHSNARRGSSAVGGSDALLRDADFLARHTPDLVVVCGRLGLSRALLGWVGTVEAPIVLVDRDGGWADPMRRADIVVAAPPASLAPVTSPGAGDGWAGSWTDAGRQVSEAVDALLEEAGLVEPRVVRDVAAAASGLLAVASSMPIRDLDATMRPRDGLRVIANRGVSGIDGLVSTAVGAALASDGPAWAVAGDLSFLHDVNGLLASPPPDLTIVVLDNDGGGIFSLLPQADDDDDATFERVFGTPHGRDLVAVASAYGASAVTVDDVGTLHELVTTRPAGLRVAVVRTDRRENARLHRRMNAVAADAVQSWLKRRAR